MLDENGRFRRLACQHYDPAKAALVRELQHDFPPDPPGVHPSIDVVRQGRSRWSPVMSDEFLRETTRGQRHFDVVKALGFTSYIVVPLIGDNAPIGAVTFVSAGSGRRFNERDVASAEQLAVQVGSVVERARRHEHEHLIAHTLQQSLLPDRLPVVAGLELAARYQPGSDFTEVGGDWYDVVKLGERIALVVGDVEGHDMEAASVMGKLRNGLSAIPHRDGLGRRRLGSARPVRHRDRDRADGHRAGRDGRARIRARRRSPRPATLHPSSSTVTAPPSSTSSRHRPSAPGSTTVHHPSPTSCSPAPCCSTPTAWSSTVIATSLSASDNWSR